MTRFEQTLWRDKTVYRCQVNGVDYRVQVIAEIDDELALVQALDGWQPFLKGSMFGSFMSCQGTVYKSKLIPERNCDEQVR